MLTLSSVLPHWVIPPITRRDSWSLCGILFSTDGSRKTYTMSQIVSVIYYGYPGAAENYMMQRPLGVTVELILGGGDNGSNSSIVTGLSNRQLISDLPRDFEDW